VVSGLTGTKHIPVLLVPVLLNPVLLNQFALDCVVYQVLICRWVLVEYRCNRSQWRPIAQPFSQRFDSCSAPAGKDLYTTVTQVYRVTGYRERFSDSFRTVTKKYALNAAGYFEFANLELSVWRFVHSVSRMTYRF
jgi:hypothetical protein